MNNQENTSFLIRLSLGFIYLSAGWAKFAPNDLGNIIGPVDISHVTESVAILTTFKLIGFFQLIIGALILSQRYSLIGLLALFPLSLGIFIFTLIGGFGGTPFFTLIFLFMNCYALIIEKENIKNLFNQRSFKNFSSVVAKDFPNKKLPYISFGLLLILILTSFWQSGMIINIIGTSSIVVIYLNLFQYKKFNFLDKIILVLFLLICFITTNGIILNTFIDKFYYSIFYLILLGLVLYSLRVLMTAYHRKVKLNQT